MTRHRFPASARSATTQSAPASKSIASDLVPRIAPPLPSPDAAIESSHWAVSCENLRKMRGFWPIRLASLRRLSTTNDQPSTAAGGCSPCAAFGSGAAARCLQPSFFINLCPSAIAREPVQPRGARTFWKFHLHTVPASIKHPVPFRALVSLHSCSRGSGFQPVASTTSGS